MSSHGLVKSLPPKGRPTLTSIVVWNRIYSTRLPRPSISLSPQDWLLRCMRWIWKTSLKRTSECTIRRLFYLSPSVYVLWRVKDSRTFGPGKTKGRHGAPAKAMLLAYANATTSNTISHLAHHELESQRWSHQMVTPGSWVLGIRMRTSVEKTLGGHWGAHWYHARERTIPDIKDTL